MQLRSCLVCCSATRCLKQRACLSAGCWLMLCWGTLPLLWHSCSACRQRAVSGKVIHLRQAHGSHRVLVVCRTQPSCTSPVAAAHPACKSSRYNVVLFLLCCSYYRSVVCALALAATASLQAQSADSNRSMQAAATLHLQAAKVIGTIKR